MNNNIPIFNQFLVFSHLTFTHLGNTPTMRIISQAFNDEAKIPEKYSCDGQNISPPLEFLEIPEGTESLTLIVEDYDAPANPWVHWLVFNIPPSSVKTEEGHIPDGGKEGLCNGNTFGYEGPCPPEGIHRYEFKLYALGTVLTLSNTSDRKAVLKAMEGHVISYAQITGMYGKNRV